MHDLLQLMYQDGFLSSTELVALRKTCRELKESPVRVLRSLNVASPAEVQGFLQRFYGCSAVTDALLDQLDESYKVLIPVDIALNYNVFAIAEEDSKLFVAVEDPTDVRLMAQIEFFLDRKIVACVATVHQLARGLSLLYGFDVSQLKLSTVLESSRGVIGGKLYEDMLSAHVPPEEKSELYLDDEFGVMEPDRDTNSTSLSLSGLPPGATLSSVADLNSGTDSLSESFESGFDVAPEASSLGLLKAMDPTSAEMTNAQNETESALTDLDSFSPDLGEDSSDQSSGFDLEESTPGAPAPSAAQLPMDLDALLAADNEEIAASLAPPAELETSSETLPSNEVNIDDLLAEHADSVEEFDFPSAADLVEPAVAQVAEMAPDLLVRISAAANSALVRLTMVREKNAGLAKLNQSLEVLQVIVSHEAGVFSIQAHGASEEWNSASEPLTPLSKVLAPALKKIASLA